MKLICSILISCLLCIGQAQATNFKLFDATSFNPEQVQVQAQSIGVPIGTVIAWTKEIIPDGWLECDGQKINDILYPELAKLMPTTPNYMGRFLQGVNTNTKVGDKIEAGLPNIYGEFNTVYNLVNTPAYRIPTGAFKSSWIVDNSNENLYSGRNSDTHWKLIFNAANSNAIYGNSTTVQPPAVTVKFIIKAE